MREADTGINRFIQNANIVMLFKRSYEPAHHDQALMLAGLFHLHYLEAPGKRRILLEVLFVLRPCRRSDGAQFAAGERRLEQVGGVVLSGLSTGADHGVCFVDEENDRRGGGFHFFNETFEPILKFALDARAGLQQRQVKGTHVHVLERRRHIALGDPQRKPFDHGRLAHTRLAGEDGVVLPPPGEDVDDLANLRIAAEHRIDLSLAGIAGKVDGVLVQVRRLAAGGFCAHHQGLPMYRQSWLSRWTSQQC